MLSKHNQIDMFTTVINQRKAAYRKRIECDWQKFAGLIGTLDDWLELAIHQVHYDGLIAFEVSLPTLLGNDVVRSTIVVRNFSVRFIYNSVEILMQSIKQIGNELTWIMLVVSWKHRLKFGDTLLEMRGGKWTLLSQPNIFYHFGVLSRELSLSAQRIVAIDIFEVLSAEEVLSQILDVWETLQSWIHEAGVAQIA